MKKLFFIIAFTLISLGKECSFESMESLLKIDIKNLDFSTMNNKILKNIKSTQGSEGKFYYEKNTKTLKYIKLIIYGEMGRRIIHFYFDNNKNILVESIVENYNHHIYDQQTDLKVLSKTIKLLPICNKSVHETFFYGIDKKDYTYMKDLVNTLKTHYQKRQENK